MARRPKAAAAPAADIDPDKIYKVKLKAPIMVGRSPLRVRDRHRLKGVHLMEHLDKVESYEAV